MSAPEFDLATLRSPSRAAGIMGLSQASAAFVSSSQNCAKEFLRFACSGDLMADRGHFANVVVMKVLLESGIFSLSLK